MGEEKREGALRCWSPSLGTASEAVSGCSWLPCPGTPAQFWCEQLILIHEVLSGNPGARAERDEHLQPLLTPRACL